VETFFIFSLPRSGSAWLSVFLTYENSFCYHEPLSEPEPLHDLFSRPGSGGVDTLAYTRPELVGRYRSFVLKRNYADIEASSRRLGVGYQAPKAEFERVTKGLPEIDYHKLRDLSYLQEVWDKIVSTAFDRDRARLLVDMNIQRDLEKFRSDRPHFASQIESLRCKAAPG
jgi:hypothetical protein